MAPWNDDSPAYALSMPMWLLFFRFCQILLAVLLLVLTAYAASRVGSGVPGFGLTWFTFIFTMIYFIWLPLSIAKFPKVYHPVAHLGYEILVNIFWLSSWAVLASEAATHDDFEFYYGGYWYVPSNFTSALNCTRAAAAFGAILWLLFCVSLAVVVSAFADHRHESAAAADVEASGGGPQGEAKATEMHNYNGGGSPGGVAGGPGFSNDQQPYAGVDANGAPLPAGQQPYVQPPYPEQTYPQEPANVQQPATQQYQEQPVTGAAPPQQSTA